MTVLDPDGDATINNPMYSSGKPSQQVSSTDDLSGVPVLGSWIAGQAQEQASQQVQQAISSGLAGILGLNNQPIILAPGTLIINGTDVGAFMKNNVPGITAAGGLTMEFAQPPASLNGHPATDVVVITTKLFSISVPSMPSLNFSLTETQFYGITGGIIP